MPDGSGSDTGRGTLAASPLWPCSAPSRCWPDVCFSLSGLVGVVWHGLLRRSIDLSGFEHPSPFAHWLMFPGRLCLAPLLTPRAAAAAASATGGADSSAGRYIWALLIQTQKSFPANCPTERSLLAQASLPLCPGRGHPSPDVVAAATTRSAPVFLAGQCRRESVLFQPRCSGPSRCQQLRLNHPDQCPPTPCVLFQAGHAPRLKGEQRPIRISDEQS